MSVYVVTAYRWGQRNAHSYVVGAFTNKTAAIECAEAHVDYRGGKYGCEVVNALEWTEDADNVAEQVYYSESPYFGKAGDAGHFHAADIKKRCVPSHTTHFFSQWLLMTSSSAPFIVAAVAVAIVIECAEFVLRNTQCFPCHPLPPRHHVLVEAIRPIISFLVKLFDFFESSLDFGIT